MIRLLTNTAAALLLGTTLIVGSAGSSAAQACGGQYTVKRGDSLSRIADEHYKDFKKWTVIHAGNLSAIGDNPNGLRVGTRLNLTCIGGLPIGLKQPEAPATPAVQTAAVETGTARPLEKTLNVLTGTDFAPFVDDDLEEGGMVTEVVMRAMEASPQADRFKLHVVRDWSAQLNPLLSKAMMDMGYPWSLPDCAQMPDYERCRDFAASESLFEFLILLFVNAEAPIPFATDSDIHGRTLCRPAGYFIFDLDREGRRWVSDGLIKMERPQTIGECFEMLMNGTVDAVTINEFTGRATVAEMGLKDRVDVVQGRPVAITGLHMLVHNDHPDRDAVLDSFNQGLRAIKDSGQYQQIIERHMTRIWAGF